MLHSGHIEFLKFCKSHGDIVVVGLNSDSSVKKIKGPDRPINNQHDRAAVLAALETVDYVTILNEPDPLNLIKKVKPDILVKGQDWAEKRRNRQRVCRIHRRQGRVGTIGRRQKLHKNNRENEASAKK